MSLNKNLEFIKNQIENNDIVLFMKGTRDFPKCGFSAQVVAILKKLEVPFLDIDVLGEQDLRFDLKQFSDWPTFPQLYIKQEFIGGCDIVVEMSKTGELLKLLHGSCNAS